MMNREISIVTGWGGLLGSGHIQRMAALASHINQHTALRAFLVCDERPGFLPDPINDILTDRIRPGSILIIRDKRDSSVSEMEELKSNARVIAIDDCGPGRDRADLPIDLLPNLNYSIHSRELFIFGYSFVDSIRMLGRRSFKKNIDYSLYCGIDPPGKTIDTILSLIPKRSSCAILTGNNSSLMDNGVIAPLNRPYAETLLSSKVLITHFGITLFEGHTAGCRLITINPADYHSRLSDRARDDLNLINLGIIDSLDIEQARSVIAGSPDKIPSLIVNASDIHKATQRGINLFLSRIQAFL